LLHKWIKYFSAFILIPHLLWSQDDATLDEWLFNDDIRLEERLWDRDINLRVSTGYSDNVLLASVFEQGSAFIGAEVEMFTWRKPQKGQVDIHLYLDAMQIHYFDVDGIDNERLVISQGQISNRLNERWTVGASIQGSYVDQVYDISPSGFELDTTTLEAVDLKFTPFIKLKYNNGYFARVAVDLRRDFFRDSMFDFTEPALEFYAGKRFDQGSSIRFDYAYAYRFFDHREQRNTSGFPLRGTSLEWESHTLDGRWEHYWNKDKSIQNRTKIGFKWNLDNGDGYYDYSLYKVSESIIFYLNKWVIEGEFAYKYYDYTIQTVSFDDPNGRYLSQMNTMFKVERKVSENWKLYFEYQRERSHSNRTEDKYIANRALIGIDWLF